MESAPTGKSQPSHWPSLAIMILLFLGFGFGGILVWNGISRKGLSSEEIAQALNLHSWVYTVPPHEDGAVLAFELVDGDKVVHFGGPSGIPVGERLVVSLRRDLKDFEKFEGAVQGRSVKFHVLIEAPVFATMNAVHLTPDGAEVNEQPLVHGNHTGSISLPFTKKRDGDVLLRVVMVKNKG